MRKNILVILVFLLILIIGNTGFGQALRYTLEKNLVLPFKKNQYKSEKNPNQRFQILSLQEKVKTLTKENLQMREQLGAIPEKSNLQPSTVVYQSDNQYILEFGYKTDFNLINHPVILNELYLGKVIRKGANMLVVSKPVSSGFKAKAISGANTEGWLKGEFNTEVIFETATTNPLSIGEVIYILDIEHGWRFLVGKIEKIREDKRLPLKQGVIKYIPSQLKPETVFVVL